MSEEITRRNLLKGAAVGAASVGVMGVLSACGGGGSSSSSEAASSAAAAAAEAGSTVEEAMAQFEMVLGAKDGSNFGRYAEEDDLHGPTSLTDDTLANLNSAMGGETGAFTKYTEFSKVAKSAGFDRIAALFEATAQAEDIHRHLEEQVAQKLDSSAKLPDAPKVSAYDTDGNLIAGARGEIYETADMYPQYIEVAIKEAEDESDSTRKAALEEAVQVFTRAKQAEAYHAKWYMDAYTTIDTPTDDPYWLCATCGFIHKGPKPATCPICGATTFEQY